MSRRRPIVLETAADRLSFDARSGRLIGMTPLGEPREELIASAPDHPVFAIQYLDEQRRYRQLDSRSARNLELTLTGTARARALTMAFGKVGGLDLDVTVTVRASKRSPLANWSLELRNSAALEIVHVEFPFIVVPYADGPDAGSALIHPFYTGVLIPNPRPQDLSADWPEAWQFTPRNGASGHYPGQVFAQFLAYYTRRAGIYLACQDARGHVKLIKPLHRDPGIRLGIAHVGDWPRQGVRRLEYNIVLGSFRGDWYAAAEIYRRWALRQTWAVPLRKRKDVPAWLLDSPPHITLRMQGVLDDGPVAPIKEFLPYEKAIPKLERIARRLRAPLVAVLMSWERGGPWVYPDCFPPVGGDASLRRFATLARKRGWHVGSFCNGSRWAMAHAWNRYDGTAFFKKNRGQESVCRTPDGQGWKEPWDAPWRPSYTCCLDAPLTRQLARDFVRRLIGWGLESIQFFDQNVGASTFPCFASDHEHPPVPGRWMTRAMGKTVAQFHQLAREAKQDGVIQSVEQPANECTLQLFQQCDVRLTPPGTDRFVPLYHYLYHQCIVMHGMMSPAPEPYHLPIANAYNGVMGEIPGAVMIGDGTLLNKDTWNWAPWEPKVGSDDDALEMMRTVTAIRRGAGRDFLVLGRMMPPASIEGVRTMAWQTGNRCHQMPAIFHAAWQAPDGRFGVALANWTSDGQDLTLTDPRLGKRVKLHLAGRTDESRPVKLADGRLPLHLPALSFALVEANLA